MAAEGLARASKGTLKTGRIFGHKVPFTRDASGANLTKGYKLTGKSNAQLAEIIDATKAKDPQKALQGLSSLNAKKMREASALPTPAGKKILDIVSRPIHAEAGAVSAAIAHKNVKKAAVAGLKGKGQTTFGDVLRQLGVKGKAASIGGFIADVGLDPTTYLTGGESSLARESAVASAKAAAKEAEKTALKSALERGETVADAKKLAKARGRSAAASKLREAERKAEQGPARATTPGITVKVAGKRLPGVTRATSKVRHVTGEAASRAADVLPERAQKKVAQTRAGTRNLGAIANANVRRAGVTKAQQREIKGLSREARAQSEKATRHLNARVNALVGRLKTDEQKTVIDAIERGRISDLKGRAPALRRSLRPGRNVGRQDPDRLFIAAKRIADDLKYSRRLGAHSGLITGRVGRGSRTAQQSWLLAHGNTRSTGTLNKVQQELNTAGKELADARREMKAADSAKEHILARRKATAAKQRFDNLTAKRDAIKSEQVTAQAVKRGQQVEQRERFGYRPRETKAQRAKRQASGASRPDVLGTEARGYFPRITKAEQEGKAGRGVLARLAQPLSDQVRPATEQVGSNKPDIAAGKQRELRGTRAQILTDPKNAHSVERLTSDVRASLGHYGASVAKGSAASDLNTRIVQQLGTPLKGRYRNLSKRDFDELADQGKSVYRVRRGQLEKVTDYNTAHKASLGERRMEHPTRPGTYVPAPKAATTKAGKVADSRALPSGGQYAILRDEDVAAVRNRLPGQATGIGHVLDVPTNVFKRVALGTPAYLVRNLVGDTYNAWTDERFWRLVRNQIRGQKALSALGHQERALGKFQLAVPESKKTITLTDAQAKAIGDALGMDPTKVSRKMKASAVAGLAEQMGVIRQGRFLELMNEGRTLTRPRGTHAWDAAVKRVEDSTRLATFLGGLQRGLNPREAAARASEVHFDYGDLTPVERRYLRRVAPFYTFSARNIPLQVRRTLTNPGKIATVEKGREEGQKGTGLPADYLSKLNPYEATQLGIPLKMGGKTFTVSMGAPFTDLNDATAVLTGPFTGDTKGAAVAGLLRVAGMANPYLKLPWEELANKSAFYRDEIQPTGNQWTRPPQWAIKLAKTNAHFRDLMGMRPDVEMNDGKGPEWGWKRKTDYWVRQMGPGAITPLLDVLGQGIKGTNARAQTKEQRLLAALGLRTSKYDPQMVELANLYQIDDALNSKLNELRDTAGLDPSEPNSADNATPAYRKLLDEESATQKKIKALQAKTRQGGLVSGKRQTSTPSGSGLDVGSDVQLGGDVTLGPDVQLGPGIDLR